MSLLTPRPHTPEKEKEAEGKEEEQIPTIQIKNVSKKKKKKNILEILCYNANKYVFTLITPEIGKASCALRELTYGP